jgi:hypothetical protein
MATEVSICSNALRRLGDDPITSLTDDTEEQDYVMPFTHQQEMQY